jgi:hypothetical protein
MRQNERSRCKNVLVNGPRLDKIALLPPGQPEKQCEQDEVSVVGSCSEQRCAQTAMTGAKAE